MLLKNKWTGETNIVKVDEDYFNICKDDGEFVCPVTLKELNEGWEDYYEEPEEEFWYIDSDCETYGVSRAFNQNDSDDVLFNKSIGNYFSSREEAEKTVEELRAFKRLKDKGFRFTSWEDLGAKLDMDDLMIFNREVIDTNNVIGFRLDDYRACIKDLDTCFGGEE